MGNMNLKPLGDKVVIKPIEVETKTAGGIYIPDTARERPQKGKVIAVGPGTKDVEMEVSVGDVVLYGKYTGVEITSVNEKYLIMHQSDILAIIEE